MKKNNMMVKVIPVDIEDILKFYKPIANNAHKGSQGHVLLIGGSYGKIGAMCLSSKAALKTGCGLVTSFIPECGYQILQSAIPEVMVITDEEQKYISNIDFDFKPNVIGIGPGIGQQKITEKAIYAFFKNSKTPLVVDADALNILSKNKAWLTILPHKTILTPHPKELERLIGKWSTEEEKFEKTISLSVQFDFIIVMKGAPTYIIYGETIFKNTTGNPALATAGSGDVLTGMISSLLGQDYSPLHAALLAVYLHGLTADIGTTKTAPQSFIASDIIDNLGEAFMRLYDFKKGN